MSVALQNFKNHRRIAWLNYASTGLLSVATVLCAIHFFHHREPFNAVVLLLAFVSVAVAWQSRANALKVQDRLIRLEERLRLERILPEALKSRISELHVRQLVALRFASDGEVPALVEKALAGMEGETIKKEIKDWRADFLRV